MQHSPPSAQSTTKQEIVDRFRAIAPRFAGRAEAAERARKIPSESVQEMLVAGLARILIPSRFDGYGLDFDAWFDVVLEISKVDASHGWCASLIIHHAHLIGQFSEEAQQAVWADGPDVAIAASFAPAAQAIRVTVLPALARSCRLRATSRAEVLRSRARSRRSTSST
jgi:3-hydroxy-9,10-secoandrosta-1,3,5(10)-triene-9,17-dione monooxygenase